MDLARATTLTQRLYQRIMFRRRGILDAEDYYRGRQPLAYASDEWRKFHSDRFGGFADNWCAVVADAPADRTAVTGFELPNADGFSREEADLWRDWQSNDMDAQQSQGFLTSRIARRSFVRVWGDSDGNPLMQWEHPQFCEIQYDDENPRLRLASLRTWRDDITEFATLETADEVWKFERTAMRDVFTGMPVSDADRLAPTGSGYGWLPRLVSGEPWPAPNPLGAVPMVEFMNRPLLRGEPLSDIAGVMAMQKAINLLWAYLFTAADHASMPARVVLGMEPPKIPVLDNVTGEVVGEKAVKLDDLARGRMMFLTGQGGSIAQWDAAKLDVFTDAIKVCVTHIAAQTRTPSHYLGLPANVNAETLTMDEIGLGQKVKETHLYSNAPLREVFRLTALVRGDKAVAESCRTGRPSWKNPEIRSEAQLADAFQKRIAAGWPFEWLARNMYGLSPSEITDVMDARKAEAKLTAKAAADAATAATAAAVEVAAAKAPDAVTAAPVKAPDKPMASGMPMPADQAPKN